MNDQFHVFLINDVEYVAARDADEATAYAKRENPYEFKHGENPDIRIADRHGYSDDGYSKGDPDRSMIEQANAMTGAGATLPFHVGVSLDCL